MAGHFRDVREASMLTRRFRISGACTSLILAAMLAACGGDSDNPMPLAETSHVTADAPVAGVTVYIASVMLHGVHFDQLASLNFVVTPLAGTFSKPVSVTYESSYLSRRGFLLSDTIQVPLFGLYAGTQNTVTLTLTFSDDSSVNLPLSVTTAADTGSLYSAPQAIVQRGAAPLGFDFIYMQAPSGSPAIVDTDGHARWLAANVTGTASSIFSGGAMILGSPTSNQITRLELDGTSTIVGPLDTPDVLDFHHDMEPGKTALLDNVDVEDNGVEQVESTLQEFTPEGHVITQWDLGKILGDYMLANGDDPTLFVRPGVDWFHMNTAIYDAADDSVIISSRENFVIKLDYTTSDIRWIFGDPTKYWYTFPSLRAKSLTLLGGGLVPIGQHGIGIAADGNLVLFNNGAPSGNQPPGAPPGQSRSYSAVSSYALDETAMTAVETWHFDYGQSIYSPFCGSARQVDDGSVLIDYATSQQITTADIVGLDASRNLAFDYRYASTFCGTAFFVKPIALDALTLD
jgi:arylsulfate sulfotransferase